MSPSRMAGKSFERILAATDFSPASEPALEEAERIARECGARLVILHAYQIPALASLATAPVRVSRRPAGS